MLYWVYALVMCPLVLKMLVINFTLYGELAMCLCADVYCIEKYTRGLILLICNKIYVGVTVFDIMEFVAGIM